ncbi:type II toxin-antitoxin system PemK/MazF family toxin [Nakamurella lactea]|uniref:type II toxin-antitoxin system PemK/MazF family toxin n=1 Tax=Nakamurella lactea TaxID=459515 RepID=UPI00040954B8|nr:type II toxin-antitoxin system PemK/MazF family toxin [Nakamurella lactea]
MSSLSKLFSSAVDALFGGNRGRAGRNQAPRAPKVAPTVTGQEHEFSPGQTGPDATVEVDPHDIATISMTYSPETDGAPDPGEVVWTWVPFEENDGRGKDRPVLVVATERSGTVLGVQLTSKQHDGADFVAVGAGGWDSERRPSWANLDRVIRIHPTGMRREATAMPHKAFAAVTDRLARRYGWTSTGA